MSDARKVILNQCAGADDEDRKYLVAELHNSVEFSIGQTLLKREVEELIRRPRWTVIIKSPKVVNA